MEILIRSILIFSFYSFLGWALESIYATLMQKRLVNRGFLSGPFCPIYGFSASAIILSAQGINRWFPENQWGFLPFLITAIVLVTLMEYLTGYLLEKIFHTKWWDYSNRFMNLHGYISLQFSLIWGGLAFLLLRYVHPYTLDFLDRIPEGMEGYLAGALTLYFTVDTIRTVTEVLDLRRTILHYMDIPLQKYEETVFRYRRFFHAFPRLLQLNAEIMNRDVRRIVTHGIQRIREEIQNRVR